MEENETPINISEFPDKSNREDSPEPLPKRRGRPPGTKNKKRESGNNVSSDDVQVDPALLASLAMEMASVGDETLFALLKNNARKKLSPNQFEEFEKDVSNLRLQPAEKETCKTALAIVIRKYSFLNRFGAEVVLGIFALQYSFRMLNAFRLVASLPKLPNEHFSKT